MFNNVLFKTEKLMSLSIINFLTEKDSLLKSTFYKNVWSKTKYIFIKTCKMMSLSVINFSAEMF